MRALCREVPLCFRLTVFLTCACYHDSSLLWTKAMKESYVHVFLFVLFLDSFTFRNSCFLNQSAVFQYELLISQHSTNENEKSRQRAGESNRKKPAIYLTSTLPRERKTVWIITDLWGAKQDKQALTRSVGTWEHRYIGDVDLYCWAASHSLFALTSAPLSYALLKHAIHSLINIDKNGSSEKGKFDFISNRYKSFYFDVAAAANHR